MNDPTVHYRSIKFASSDYAQSLSLRDQVLRRPWGQSIDQDDLSSESDDFIWGAFVGSRLVGMAVLKEGQDNYARLRYMAVDPDYQGRGIGAAIAREFEARARQAGKAGIRLMARLHVLPFYEKLGYETEGQAFVPDHIDIPHIMMVTRFRGPL